MSRQQKTKEQIDTLRVSLILRSARSPIIHLFAFGVLILEAFLASCLLLTGLAHALFPTFAIFFALSFSVIFGLYLRFGAETLEEMRGEDIKLRYNEQFVQLSSALNQILHRWRSDHGDNTPD